MNLYLVDYEEEDGNSDWKLIIASDHKEAIIKAKQLLIEDWNLNAIDDLDIADIDAHLINEVDGHKIIVQDQKA